VSVQGCLFEGNQALGGPSGSGFYSGPGEVGGGYGGAIFGLGGELLSGDLTHSDNVADTDGADIYTDP
jgi:hypothetical protein